MKWIAVWSLVVIGMPLKMLAQGPGAANTKQVVQEAQQQLRALGYDPGAADGVMGSKTVGALKKFQSDHDLPVTGALDQKTSNALATAKASGPAPVAKGEQAAALAQIVGKIGARDEYGALDLATIVKMYDENHDIDALKPLERQAVLDVLLQRVYVTRKAQYKYSGLPISEAGTEYLKESPSGGLTSSGTITGKTPDGHSYQLDIIGTAVMSDGHILMLGKGQLAMGTKEITKPFLKGAKGSLTIASAPGEIWVLSTRLPRDRIATGPMGVSGMGSVVFPIGDGSMYRFSGEIKGFLPGTTITTPGDKTAYFALIAGMGVVYLAGEATVSSDDHPERKINLPAP